MKIYLAGSCSSERRTAMTEVAKTLRAKGYDVYCPFELKIPNAWDMSQEEWAQRVFDADVKALSEADCMVMMTPGRESTAGTNWEQGYAYAKGIPIYVFQYTNHDTSLMTYCGCDNFTVVDKNIYNACRTIGDFHYLETANKNRAQTILT